MKKIIALFLIGVIMLSTVIMPIYAMPYLSSNNVETVTSTDNMVANGNIETFYFDNNRIFGEILVNGITIPYDINVKWYKIFSEDLLNGTLIANIINCKNNIQVVNVSIGKNREAALGNNNLYDPEDIVIKIALLDIEHNKYYNTMKLVDNDTLIYMNNIATPISNDNNSDLYNMLICQEKWYNNIFRNKMIANNIITSINNVEEDVPQENSQSYNSFSPSTVTASSMDDLIDRIGESKFKTANRVYNPGIVYDSEYGYNGYYMETYENFDDAIVTYVIYYTLTANIDRGSSSSYTDGYASLTLSIKYNNEIWYYPSTGEFMDLGVCQLKLRKAGLAISLTGNNPDFIWRMENIAYTSSGVTEIPTFGVEFIPRIGEYLSVGLDIFNSISESVNANTSNGFQTYEYPMDPNEHVGQCDGYLREVTAQTSQGLNNNWFVEDDDRIILRADFYSDNSSSSKEVTYNITYEVCFPNSIGWYTTIETVEDQFEKLY